MVHILPYMGAYAIGMVGQSLVHRGIVSQQYKQRAEQTGGAEFSHTVLFAVIVNADLCGGSRPHHLDAPAAALLKIGVHGLIPFFGDQRQLLRLAGGMVAHRVGLQAVPGQNDRQRRIEGLIDGEDVIHLGFGNDTDLQLAGRLQRNTVQRVVIPHVQPVNVHRRVVGSLHLLHDSLNLLKGHRRAIGMGHKMLHLHTEGQLALRFAAFGEVANQFLFLCW